VATGGGYKNCETIWQEFFTTVGFGILSAAKNKEQGLKRGSPCGTLQASRKDSKK